MSLLVSTKIPGFVYRIYDDAGRLLYVGRSRNVSQRLSAHTRKPWAGEISRIEIQRYATELDAEFAERDAIRTEDPLYNVVSKPKASKVDRVNALVSAVTEARRTIERIEAA